MFHREVNLVPSFLLTSPHQRYWQKGCSLKSKIIWHLAYKESFILASKKPKLGLRLNKYGKYTLLKNNLNLNFCIFEQMKHLKLLKIQFPLEALLKPNKMLKTLLCICQYIAHLQNLLKKQNPKYPGLDTLLFFKK